MVSTSPSSYGYTWEVAYLKRRQKVAWRDGWVLLWLLDIILSNFSFHWKLTDMHFNTFIASSSCIHKIMEPADDVSKLLHWKKLCVTLLDMCYIINILQAYRILTEQQYDCWMQWKIVHVTNSLLLYYAPKIMNYYIFLSYTSISISISVTII